MIIKALMENTALSPVFQAEHGLSLYIEANGHKILFDMGQSPAFADNAKAMGVDLPKVDFAVLSHAHYDHSGGMQAFLSQNSRAPVYISPYAFDETLNAAGEYIGLDAALRGNPRLVPVIDPLRTAEGIAILSLEGHALGYPVDSCGLQVRRSGAVLPDDFRHEQYLLLTEGDKRVLISGCSHRGIVNIVHAFHPDVLIGGFSPDEARPAGRRKETLNRPCGGTIKI